MTVWAPLVARRKEKREKRNTEEDTILVERRHRDTHRHRNPSHAHTTHIQGYKTETTNGGSVANAILIMRAEET
jgi:hypothetical protein